MLNRGVERVTFRLSKLLKTCYRDKIHPRVIIFNKINLRLRVPASKEEGSSGVVFNPLQLSDHLLKIYSFVLTS
jgi:hypothetical protein